MKTIAGIYSIFVGAVVVGLWAFLLLTGQVEEIATEPASIYAHILAELTMAALLIVSGYGLLKNLIWSSQIFFVAAGLLIYSTINSSGYYMEIGNLPVVFVFGILLTLTLLIVAGLIWKADH